MNYARFVKAKDMWSSAEDSCHETSGVDIDAVMTLNAASSSSQCAVSIFPDYGILSGSDDWTVPDPETPITHSVPGWITGSWHLLSLNFGYHVAQYDMTMTITETGFEYHYPGCDVYGLLSMDASLPSHANNYYSLLMTEVDCPNRWDIETFDGAIDYGHIWADDNGTTFYRLPDVYSNIVWIYEKL